MYPAPPATPPRYENYTSPPNSVLKRRRTTSPHKMPLESGVYGQASPSGFARQSLATIEAPQALTLGMIFRALM